MTSLFLWNGHCQIVSCRTLEFQWWYRGHCRIGRDQTGWVSTEQLLLLPAADIQLLDKRSSDKKLLYHCYYYFYISALGSWVGLLSRSRVSLQYFCVIYQKLMLSYSTVSQAALAPDLDALSEQAFHPSRITIQSLSPASYMILILTSLERKKKRRRNEARKRNKW